jgi:16S rRNA (adenine1518-N6/adenine1519-N6)-dimethyltransferase
MSRRTTGGKGAGRLSEPERSSKAPARFSRKRFGQHFLEPAWVGKVVQAIDPRPDDDFVEIGPGRGALTRPLLERAHSVLAFEIDRDLAADLRGIDARLTVVEGDFLDSAGILLARRSSPLRVAGNLPYNIASPILFKLLDLHASGVPLTDATLMLQREVADRLIAPSGGRDYGVLAILVRHTADVDLLLQLPPGAFRPPPKVRSALVRLRFREARPQADNPELFTVLVRAIFTRRRKTVANALLAFPLTAQMPPDEALARAEIDGRRRPETLTIEELVRLADAFGPSARAGGFSPTRST